MKHTTRLGAALLSLSLMLIPLAACTGNSSGTTAPGSSGTNPTESETISIGIAQYMEHGALDAARMGFINRLAELGYTEGVNLEIEFSNAQGEPANAQTISQQFAAADFDLILAIATPTAQAMANAIKDTPLLFTAVTDPVDADLVASNEAPGGNVTGTSDLNPIKEQIELLTRLVPDAKTVAIMYASSEPNSVIQGELALEELASHGLEGKLYTTPTSNDLQSVIESSVGQVDAWYIPTDNMFASSMPLVRQVAVANKIPVIIGEEDMMRAGALATVSLDYERLGEATADMAFEILENGRDPGSIPVGFQEDPVLHVNEEFAAEIGLEIPEDILAEAGASD